MRILARRPLPNSAVVLATCLLLSGCLANGPSGAPEQDAAVASPSALPPESIHLEADWVMDFGFGALVAAGNSPLTGPRHYEFESSTEAFLRVESAWTCRTGPLCSLALVLHDEDGRPITYVEGTSPLTLETEVGPEPHIVAMWSDQNGSVILDASGTFAVVLTPATADRPM